MSDLITDCDAPTVAWLTLRIVLAGVLLWSAVAKARSSAAVSPMLESIGAPAIIPTMRALPWLEGSLALALLGNVSGASAAVAFVLGVFLLVLGRAWFAGYRGSCGCFGRRDSSGIVLATLRTGLLFAAAMALAIVAGSTTCSATFGATAWVGLTAVLSFGLFAVYATLRLTRGLPVVGTPSVTERF